MNKRSGCATSARPFALATVVAARQPTSGSPGARAIILPDGQLEGWVGGHCARPTVIRQGLDALAEGTSRLVVLTPDARETTHPAAGVVQVPMLCAGQGELQVFVEPFLPKAALVVVGESPVARALARFATLLNFEVWACDPAVDMETFPEADRLVPSLDALAPQLTERNYVIIATIGEYDEEAAQVALGSSASYVGLVASKTRLTAVRAYLKEHGVATSGSPRSSVRKDCPAWPSSPRRSPSASWPSCWRSAASEWACSTPRQRPNAPRPSTPSVA